MLIVRLSDEAAFLERDVGYRVVVRRNSLGIAPAIITSLVSDVVVKRSAAVANVRRDPRDVLSREAALAQFIYLVMFSYAFFLKGFTGLAITIGSVLTLFVVMQVTGRIRWADKFAVKPPPQPAAEMQ